ncbi:MAG: ATP-binding protein [archaeon]
MKFVNRDKELKFVRECEQLSENKLFSLCIYGLRRVGKTRLILESIDKDDIYFFVNKDKGSESLLKEYERLLKDKKILTELETFRNWDDFFDILFNRFKGNIVFDEFQNFVHIDKSVFGILQKNIDINENNKGINIIFSGSTVGLIKRIFLDRKEPLYGRVKRRMELKPLSFHNIIKICNELDITDLEDVIILYSVFGGFPQYYVSIEDEKLRGKKPEEIFDRFFFVENSVFEDEVSTILSLEFGKRRGVYYDILSAISNGNTRISEIASYLNKKENTLTRQMNELINYFNMVGVKNQVYGSKTLMFIEHPLVNFWFRFFYKNLSQYKIRDKFLINNIKKDLSSYVGRRFEKVCEEVLVDSNIIPFNFTKIGNQWGKFKGEKGKNDYEIDIVALNEKSKEILFGECKWKDKVDAEKVIKEIKEKAEYLEWNNNKQKDKRKEKDNKEDKKEIKNRKEYFAIFAKSFKNNKKISEFEGKKVYCFDLRDLDKMVKSR